MKNKDQQLLSRSQKILEVSMREFLERVIDERDRLYDSRFRAAEIAVNAALAAQEKAVTAAFLASEKAIIKAEEAQKDYNNRSNEFRGQLDDQAKRLMARDESLGLFKAGDDKLETMRLFIDSKMESQRLSFEKSSETFTKALEASRLSLTGFLATDVYESRHTELQRQVNDLRESRSEISGQKVGAREILAYILAASGIALALIYHFIR